MTWFKTDDKLHSHPKARQAGLEAMGLWQMAGTYCADYETDGIVPMWYVETWPGSKKLAARLVRARLWHPITEDALCHAAHDPCITRLELARHEGKAGWVFHDWIEYQPTLEQIARARAKTADRQRRFRDRRNGSHPDA